MKKYIEFSIVSLFIFGVSFSSAFAQSDPSDFRWETPPEGFEDVVVGSSIAYGDGVFVVAMHPPIGRDSYIRTSTDGETWVDRYTSEDINWTHVVYGDGMFIVFGVDVENDSADVITRSTDGGITWSLAQAGPDVGYTASVSYGDGLFVASSYNRISASENGLDWDYFDTTILGSSINIKDIVFTEDRFVIVGSESTNGKTYILEKTNGLWEDNWQTIDSPQFDTQMQRIVYGNGTLIVVPSIIPESGEENTLYVSTDGGESWDDVTIEIEGFEFESFTPALAYGNDLFVIIVRKFIKANTKSEPPTEASTEYWTLTSLDGQTWELGDESDLAVSYEENNIMAYGNDMFVLLPTLAEEGFPSDILFARWPLSSSQEEETPAPSRRSSSRSSTRNIARARELFAQVQTTPSATEEAIVTEETPAPTTEVRNLFLGERGPDVRMLQLLLIAEGYAIPDGPTDFFGNQTKQALSQYQATNGITPAAGYFGPLTRAHMKTAQGENVWW